MSQRTECPVEPCYYRYHRPLKEVVSLLNLTLLIVSSNLAVRQVDPFCILIYVAFPLDGSEYNVPKSVVVDEDTKFLQGTYITYKNGAEATNAFLADANLSARYMAFSRSASASYSVEKTFRREEQFALYAFNASFYNAALRNYIDLLNTTALVNRLSTLPQPFKSDEATLREYKSFFTSFGSHIITNTGYGARFQLVCGCFTPFLSS